MHQMNTATPTAADAPAAAPLLTTLTEELDAVKRKVLNKDLEFRYYESTSSLYKANGLLNILISTEGETHDPDVAFDRLRWGGLYICASSRKSEIREAAQRFLERGFVLDRGPNYVWSEWGVPIISPKAHYFIARKTQLGRPKEFSDRFTYQVELERRDDAHAEGPPGTEHWVVRKQVPSFERILARLQHKAPHLPLETLERRAKKFADQIFPLFLTREAAMLKVIERDCPAEYIHRFPRIIDLEKDEAGYVRVLRTTWLRNGGKPMPQIEFARQGADLLQVLHDKIGIIHLDLRMDNMVITENGVGFVDFGSAVRAGEDIQGNAVLSTLFGELMKTSHIQKMLDRMSTAGSLTSHVIRDAYQRVDKAVDLFYLAVQMNQPNTTPELREMICYEKFSPEAVAISGLTDSVLRPIDPQHPRLRTAHDLLVEVQKIEADLRSGKYTPTPAQQLSAPKPRIWIWK
jgi:hypothetical protein